MAGSLSVMRGRCKVPEWVTNILSLGRTYPPWVTSIVLLLLAGVVLLLLYGQVDKSRPEPQNLKPLNPNGGVTFSQWKKKDVRICTTETGHYWLQANELIAIAGDYPLAFGSKTDICGQDYAFAQVTIRAKAQETDDGKFTADLTGIVLRRQGQLQEVIDLDPASGKLSGRAWSTEQTWTVPDYHAGQQIEVFVLFKVEKQKQQTSMRNLSGEQLFTCEVKVQK
jgi:hypothetical protein